MPCHFLIYFPRSSTVVGYSTCISLLRKYIQRSDKFLPVYKGESCLTCFCLPGSLSRWPTFDKEQVDDDLVILNQMNELCNQLQCNHQVCPALIGHSLEQTLTQQNDTRTRTPTPLLMGYTISILPSSLNFFHGIF